MRDMARAALMQTCESLADAVIAVDSGGTVIAFNAAAELAWGFPRTVVLQKPAADVIGEWQRLDTCPAGGVVEVAITRGGGETVWLSVSRSDVMGNPAGAWRIFVGRDVSEAVRHREQVELLSLAVDRTDRAVLIVGPELEIIYCNRGFTELYGYDADEVRGKHAAALLLQPPDRSEVKAVAGQPVFEADGIEEDVLTYDRQGLEVWVSAAVNRVLDVHGAVRFTVAVLSNVTRSKQLERLQRDVLEAVAQDRPLKQIMETICARVSQIAPDTIPTMLLVDEHKRMRPLVALGLPEAYSAAIDGVPVGPNAGSCGTAAWRGEPVMVIDTQTDPLWRDYRELAASFGLAACWSSPVKLRNGRVAGTFAFYFREPRSPSRWHEEIVDAVLDLCVVAIERDESKARIARLAFYDPLTGLPNRALLRDRIHARTEAAGSDQEFAVLFLDVDRFKDVNDTLGHAVGDELLVTVARRLQHELRQGDAVSRHGGDEFVVMLADCNALRAAAVAERIMASLARPVQVEGLSLTVSVSIGIANYPADGRDEQELLRKADAAMYQAKGEGRGRVRFFSGHTHTLAQDRLMLGTALREAVGRGHLSLCYQPKVGAADGRLVGVEALARWRHPQLGEIAPERFIALAEGTGLIEQIGAWAVEEACRQMREWVDRGIGVPSVAVNMSPLHFRNRALNTLIADALARHRLDSGALTVEITEGAMMGELPLAIENARALHDAGVGLSMDDFGTGYSSLGYLAKLPVTEIKIDRRFMAELESDANAQAVTRAVIGIGQSLGLTVVAEGVETDAQRRFLTALDCDVLQGYLISRPLTVAQLEDWLARTPVQPWAEGRDAGRARVAG